MNWLSVDSGSYDTGIVAWEGDRPRKRGLVTFPRERTRSGKPRAWPLEKRLAVTVVAFRDMGRGCRIELVAIEKALTIPKRPATDAVAVFKRLCEVATEEGWEVVVYPPSTVTASVRPRDSRGWDTKLVIATGCKGLYGNQIPDLAEWEQDLLDALAVGHCHLGRIKEAKLTAEAF